MGGLKAHNGRSTAVYSHNLAKVENLSTQPRNGNKIVTKETNLCYGFQPKKKKKKIYSQVGCHRNELMGHFSRICGTLDWLALSMVACA